MDVLDDNNISVIAAYLTNDAIKSLSHISTKLHNKINKVKSNQLFWKERLEIEMEKILPDRIDIDWKKA
jgi:hypothetical protein